MKKTFQKNIWFLVALIVFVFTFGIDTVSAKSLDMTRPATNARITPNQTFPITVTTSPVQASVPIQLGLWDDPVNSPIGWVNVNPSSMRCTTDASGACIFNLTPTQVGKFNISAVSSGYAQALTSMPIVVANNLSVTANPPNPQDNQDSIITVTTSDAKQGVVINFAGPSNVSGFPSMLSSMSCSTNASGSCNVTFNSTRFQVSNITITVTATGYHGTSIYMDVGAPPPPPPPPPIPVQNPSIYYPLAPLPDPQPFGTSPDPNRLLTQIDVGSSGSFGNYFNTIITFIIGMAAVLAVIMIIMGGLEYMTESIAHKNEGKKRITDALLGLLLALAAYALLNTINPALLKSFFKVPVTQIKFDGGDDHVILADNSGICNIQTILSNGQIVTSCNDVDIIPITFMGQNNVRVNKAVATDLQAIDGAWQTSNPKYNVTSVDGYNPRRATNSTQPSAHAFGIAVDINPGPNPYNNANPPQCKTDMTQAFVQLFITRQWGWGGYWNRVKDPMHFSKMDIEAALSGTCSTLKP